MRREEDAHAWRDGRLGRARAVACSGIKRGLGIIQLGLLAIVPT